MLVVDVIPGKAGCLRPQAVCPPPILCSATLALHRDYLAMRQFKRNLFAM